MRYTPVLKAPAASYSLSTVTNRIGIQKCGYILYAHRSFEVWHSTIGQTYMGCVRLDYFLLNNNILLLSHFIWFCVYL